MVPAVQSQTLLLTPHGRLRVVADNLGTADTHYLNAFSNSEGDGLLHLGATQIGNTLPPVPAFWRDFAARYVTLVCATPEGCDIAVAAPSNVFLQTTIANAPPMEGAEYLTVEMLQACWAQIGAALKVALANAGCGLQQYLNNCNPAWNLVGRVVFNLAENRKDPDYPFAFLATYTSQLSAHGRAQHLPLSQALMEFSDGNSRQQLLSLLKPVQSAAAQCPWLRTMVDKDEIYHPLRWLPADAFQFLSDAPKLEAAGVMVRAPQSWAKGRPARPIVKASLGTTPPSLLGQNALLDFQLEVTLDGETLNATDINALLQGSDGLQLIRGRWVEVNKQKLARMLARFENIEATAAASGLPFAEAMRLIAGASLDDSDQSDDADWSELVAGPWLAETLQNLRQPEGLANISVGTALKATLRPYQENGVRWLYLLTRLGLGACLADDMGLGKTIQVLALLLVLKREQDQQFRSNISYRPCLLVVPASLLGNWASEAARFAPSLRVLIVHSSAMPLAELKALDAAKLQAFDLVITSYGSLLRLGIFESMDWHIAIIDEAQAIKNPGAKQTRQVKKIKAVTRIALTGTPVENRLSDLWSIFDFTHPGLLGSSKVFANFTKRLSDNEQFSPLRNLVRPYILRRLKTDKKVIHDLPDKTELKTWCHLSGTQAALYQQAVDDLKTALSDTSKEAGIARKGLVLGSLMRFKQICNHPSQWLGDGAWVADDSGKFSRLRELAEVIAAKQEKVLVFTQFRETTEPLAAFLGQIFGRDGLVLHGGTPVAKRRDMVKQFQEDELIPFFVLSLKAGGAGLNLTAASHVIHFDRWWNPAVENQATDRAFRIGQQRNVLVHKFICKGTVEDKIDALIESKQQLVQDVLEGGAELLLTEMSDKALLDLVKLDIHSAQES
jgi:SNF2-related domain/SNF2 Helicase protein/Helicase conserved C-terminal domain